MISYLHALAELFTANPLAQSVGLLGFAMGIASFLQRSDRRLRVLIALYCLVMGSHFFLLGGLTAAYAVWLSGLRSYVSLHTRRMAVMWLFILLIWILGVPHITRPIQWLTVIGASLGTWGLYREQGIRLRAALMTNTVCWVIHNVVVGSIGGALTEGSFLVVNTLTMYRLWRQRRASMTRTSGRSRE